MAWRTSTIPEPKTPRPQTISDAKGIINKCFADNNWGLVEQKSYFQILGIKNMDTEENIRIIIADLDKSKMVRFEKSK